MGIRDTTWQNTVITSRFSDLKTLFTLTLLNQTIEPLVYAKMPVHNKAVLQYYRIIIVTVRCNVLWYVSRAEVIFGMPVIFSPSEAVNTAEKSQ